MSSLLSELKTAVKEHKRTYKMVNRLCKDNEEDLVHMEKVLKDIPIVRVAFDTDSIDISVSGDYMVLKAIFSAFLKAGYKPDSRPTEEKLSSFNTYFTHPQRPLRFYLYFSSTLCRRVKIGTKMQEVAVYETVCE